MRHILVIWISYLYKYAFCLHTSNSFFGIPTFFLWRLFSALAWLYLNSNFNCWPLGFGPKSQCGGLLVHSSVYNFYSHILLSEVKPWYLVVSQGRVTVMFMDNIVVSLFLLVVPGFLSGILNKWKASSSSHTLQELGTIGNQVYLIQKDKPSEDCYQCRKW